MKQFPRHFCNVYTDGLIQRNGGPVVMLLDIGLERKHFTARVIIPDRVHNHRKRVLIRGLQTSLDSKCRENEDASHMTKNIVI